MSVAKQLPSVCLVCLMTITASAEITPNVFVYDVGPLIGTGDAFVTYRVVVATSETDDWTSASISVSLSNAVFFQDAGNDTNPPDPALFDDYPDSNLTTYYTCPADYPNQIYQGSMFTFDTGPTETVDTLSATWSDTVTSADGTYVIAQITVLPESSSWTGLIDLAVYSASNPAGVTEQYTISQDDYDSVVTATFTGVSGGFYNTPTNWNIGTVPINGGGSQYNVLIPANRSVDYDIIGSSEISGMSLGDDSTLTIGADESLRVRSTTIISGNIDASGANASFDAPSSFSAFSGDDPKIYVADGATVHIAAPSYYWAPAGNQQSTTLLSASGSDSLLDLSSLVNINVPEYYIGSASYIYSMLAEDSGIIDLSNVTSASGPTGSNEWLKFEINTGGSILLDSLENSSERVWYDINIPTYTLPSFQAASEAWMDATDADQLNLPALQSFDSGTITLSNTTTIDVPQLESFTWSTLDYTDGGTVNAQVLTDVQGSFIALDSQTTLSHPPFTSIANARFSVESGATIETADPSYYWAPPNNQTDTVLLSAVNEDSLLNMTSVTSIDVPKYYIGSASYIYSIEAEDSGIIDLSNATSIAGSSSDNEWLQFKINTGGDIRLDSLQTLSRRVQFDLHVSQYEFPSLTQALGATSLQLSEATHLSVPALTTFGDVGSEIEIPDFAKLDAPILTSMNGTSIELSVGAYLIAPFLTTFTNSQLALSQIEQGGPFLDLPVFQNITGSNIFLSNFSTFDVNSSIGLVDARFSVESGSELVISAPSYIWDPPVNFQDTVLLSSSGNGSVLDLSSITSLSVPKFNIGSAQYTYSAVAEDSGILDLSNVSTITAMTGSNEIFLIKAESNGYIHLGDVEVPVGRVHMAVDGTGSLIEFDGGFTLNDATTLTTTLGGTIRIAGDFSYSHSSEANFDTAAGIFHMDGSGIQTFEASSENIGTPEGTVLDNFAFGQLIVGESDLPTIVKLVDDIDNQNRGAFDTEAVYLQGITGSVSGLRILGGSTLVIENIQLFVQQNDAWVHINSLFGPGVNQIAYDDGFIALSIVTSDCNANGIDDHVDILLGYSLDCNENDVPDDCDITSGSSLDENTNDIPDECEDCDENSIADFIDLAECDDSSWCSDCNTNGILDTCDIAAGTSTDVDANEIPDECEDDCNDNDIPDAWDISSGTSEDCNFNNIPDECDLAAGTSHDVNANDIPDECEVDCNDNNVPDPWDLYLGTSQDCNENTIPDECDIDEGTSIDADADGIPDECEEDCNGNNMPDDADIETGTSQDCNENTVPDECDLSSGTSADGNANGIPDECEDCNSNGLLDFVDILNGTSQDCDSDGKPDECEIEFVQFNWIGSDGGSFLDPANWDPNAIPQGDVLLANNEIGQNTAVIEDAGKATLCSLTIEGNVAPQKLQIENTELEAVYGASVNNGGYIELLNGKLSGDWIDNQSDIRGFGTITAPITNQGTLASSGGNLMLTGATLTNEPAGTLRAASGTLLNIRNGTFTQNGTMDARAGATIQTEGSLSNSPDATINILGGSIASPFFNNQPDATISGFGNIDAPLANSGDLFVMADMQALKTVVNTGTITVQNGMLSIIGTFTNNGTLIGDFSQSKDVDQSWPVKRGHGLFTSGDYNAGPDATQKLPTASATFSVAGNYNVEINDHTQYEMNMATLRLVATDETQTLEAMSTDIGPSPLGLDRTIPGHYPLGTLQIGPTKTTVQLVDTFDNDIQGQTQTEAIYVDYLQVEADATLNNPAIRIYYNRADIHGTVSNPENLIPIGILGDLDDDGDVDLDDFELWQACHYGPGEGYTLPCCQKADLNEDGDIDLQDFAIFQGLIEIE